MSDDIEANIIDDTPTPVVFGKAYLTEEQLDETQREALIMALDMEKRITAITGAAGSGKTVLMALIAEKLRDAGYNPCFLAPTGKAARRIRDATGLPARTIHMHLEYTSPKDIDPRTGKPCGYTYPRRDRQNPIENDVVICDEFAMVNEELYCNLRDAIPKGGKLIVLGDESQLPPIENNKNRADVGKPSPFKMLLDKFNGIYLTKVHRQTEGSGILTAAQAILKGRAPRNDGPNGKWNDFELIVTDTPLDSVIEEAAAVDYTSLRNQIITPMNNSWVGQVKLNQRLQEFYHRSDRETIKLPRYTPKDAEVRVGVGDKVIMCKNWYDLECSDGSLGVFNGETGIIIEISDVEEIVIDFDDRICRVPPIVTFTVGTSAVIGCPQKDIQLAYAVTTHKAQGSEYSNVTYVMNKSVVIMCNRRNFYTGLTRARDRVKIITDMRALSMSVTQKEQKTW